jgi:hypothetical protein
MRADAARGPLDRRAQGALVVRAVIKRSDWSEPCGQAEAGLDRLDFLGDGADLCEREALRCGEHLCVGLEQRRERRRVVFVRLDEIEGGAQERL